MSRAMNETQFQNEIKTNYIKYCSVNSEPIEISKKRMEIWKSREIAPLKPFIRKLNERNCDIIIKKCEPNINHDRSI